MNHDDRRTTEPPRDGGAVAGEAGDGAMVPATTHWTNPRTADDLLITLTVSSYIEVGVQDHNTDQNTQTALAPRPVDLLDTGGRGLHPVNAPATEWGTLTAETASDPPR